MGAHMYADRCAEARDRAVVYLCVYSPASWKLGSEEWFWGRRGAGLSPPGFCFSLENVVGSLFLIGLDPPGFGGRGSVVERWSVLQRSGPSSALGGTGCGAGLAVRSRPRSVGAPLCT